MYYSRILFDTTIFYQQELIFATLSEQIVRRTNARKKGQKAGKRGFADRQPEQHIGFSGQDKLIKLQKC